MRTVNMQTRANSIFDGPVTNILVIMCILIEVVSGTNVVKTLVTNLSAIATVILHICKNLGLICQP